MANVVATQILMRQIVFILKILILINNQLSSTANAKDINTDYYITNSTLASRIGSVEVGKKTSIKIRGFEPRQGRMFSLNFFL